MATCPKCMKEKPSLAPYCPNCTQRVTAGEEISFAIWEWIVAIVLLVIIFSWIAS
jgi:predicted amidophosphoribosyltransferase